MGRNKTEDSGERGESWGKTSKKHLVFGTILLTLSKNLRFPYVSYLR